jgi:hypothetical protein
MSAFARGQGFEPQRLWWWKKRLGEWGAEEGKARVPLVPAVIRASADPALGCAPVSVRLAEGVVIEVAETSSVAPDWLVAVVGGLLGRP